MIFGTNYLGHFLLVQLLLPVLARTGTASDPSRVVLLSSVMYGARFQQRTL
jgi:NAD(P)-dependent dehydrogenase (short-subunit alcohol dehydrogenase family)